MVEFSIEPRKTAVIAIDLQNCFVENSPYAAPSALRVVEQLNALTMHYRAAGSTIIWTRHVVRAYHSDLGVLGQTMPPVTQGVIDDGTASSALHPNVEVQAGDIVLNKPQFGAFSSTGHSNRSCGRVGLTPSSSEELQQTSVARPQRVRLTLVSSG